MNTNTAKVHDIKNASSERQQFNVDLSYCPSPFSLWNKIARVTWAMIWLLLFRISPRPFHGWRRFVLRIFGAKIGRGVHPYPSCRIMQPWMLEIGDYSCLGPYVVCYAGDRIKIGAYSTVSQYTHLCTSSHDYQQKNMPLITAPILIEDQVWICADSFIGPGVTIHQGAVVGARSSVFKDIRPWTVVGGNPAKYIKEREFIG
jgi:putative colanic acid biosynthesis acetyltransferase WcaF